MGSEWILETVAGGVDWIQVAQDRDRWRAVECGDEPLDSCASELLG
jgi:hypothetical protein